jgi:hypothetical protein
MSVNHLLGLDGQGGYYFWSGIAQGVGSVGLLGGAYALYRKHTCHVGHCHRLAKQKIDGSEWMVCHKHHPAGEATVEKIAAHLERQSS